MATSAFVERICSGLLGVVAGGKKPIFGGSPVGESGYLVTSQELCEGSTQREEDVSGDSKDDFQIWIVGFA